MPDTGLGCIRSWWWGRIMHSASVPLSRSLHFHQKGYGDGGSSLRSLNHYLFHRRMVDDEPPREKNISPHGSCTTTSTTPIVTAKELNGAGAGTAGGLGRGGGGFAALGQAACPLGLGFGGGGGGGGGLGRLLRRGAEPAPDDELGASPSPSSAC